MATIERGAAGIDLYVYYRVKADDAQALRDAARGMQAALQREHGVACSLKRRPEAKDGMHTWMEVYLSVPAGFDAILEEAAADDALRRLIAGPRHTETFLEIA
ncbi:protein of unknown function [Noviherbaspirillum humi]|uniref:DUF4936 domain-containing protein n=1 Tax=Noviherbaspirillum humi TaxID=1688639 RepID=A0A239HBQ0_9BURK|nr:DUF4936 family protein [Noviherbaspirillum humi]SNS78448.1 protein of unknown function [Noviherbaspirillum humi]